MRTIVSILLGLSCLVLLISTSLTTPTRSVTHASSSDRSITDIPPFAFPVPISSIPVSTSGARYIPPKVDVTISARKWAQATRAARTYAHRRSGRVRFVFITPTGGHRVFRPDEQTHANSVIKAVFLVAYLRRASVRHRRLTKNERQLLRPMIHSSDNDTASRTLEIVGLRAVARLGKLAGMKRFQPVDGLWGASFITARDQAKLFLEIDRLVPRPHRAYARRLLANIVPWQRWGIPPVRPGGWKVYFKGGWNGYGRVNQIALLTRGKQRMSLAVLSDGPSHNYSIASIRGVAARILKPLRTR